MKIKIGLNVRDVITGFTGVAIQRTEELSGNIRFAVQRKQNEGDVAYPDAIMMDHHTLEVLDDGVLDRVTPCDEAKIAIGSKVKDKATGLTGIVIERTFYMNGCIRYGVVPEKEKGSLITGNPDMAYIDQGRLEVIGDGLAAKPVSVKAPGGPAMRLQTPTARR